MITADQLVAHAIGDYLLQSDWMATKKRTSIGVACVHAWVYTLCFMPFVLWRDDGMAALSVIFTTHALIDHYGLARYVVWAKNFLAPRWMPYLRPARIVVLWPIGVSCAMRSCRTQPAVVGVHRHRLPA
jgi:hypothetical protein